MKLEQNQEQTLVQVLIQKVIVGICILVLVTITTLFTLSEPARNFARSYKPLPTSELHHH
jgi:hypothetical protein